MKEFTPYPIDLDATRIQFLQEIAAKHQLTDPGKAIRCLINYARENPDKHGDIFEEVRCLEC